MSKLIKLRQHLKQQQHRQLVVITGSTSWQQSQVQTLFNANETVFWMTSKRSEKPTEDDIPLEFKFSGFSAIEPTQLTHYLGQEIDGAIFDVNKGISADALGIVSGMIRSGGLLIILAPELDTWLSLNNPEDSRFLNSPITLHQSYKLFTKHLINSWQANQVIWLDEYNEFEIDDKPQEQIKLSLPTVDQEQVLIKINHVAFGHRKRPLVMTADRGRGKTSALGLAAIDCFIKGKTHIVITASRLDQTKAAFNVAVKTLSDMAEQDADINFITRKNDVIQFTFNNELKTFEFIAPDQLILSPTAADLVLVDEAAHLPTPMLNQLLMRHHRMVFSTTLHGYEGSGRGFELRFKKCLDRHTPDWKSIHLTTPIRWSKNDPLEKVMFDTLLLNTKISELEDTLIENIHSERVTLQVMKPHDLLEQPDKLKSLFGLLVQAHYQTSPNDLQQLLNAPNIHIVIAKYDDKQQQTIIGAALCIMEGKINPSQKRAHGHLVPQLLTRNYAQTDFLMLSTLRIMRIAVHPSLQRQGIGEKLIQFIEQLGLQQRIDYISSSFGSCDELLPFWFNQSFWPLHVGSKRDKSSGSHNVVVAKPISAMSRQALSLIQTRFQEQFPHLLLESVPQMSSNQVLQIIETFRFKTTNYGLDKAVLNYQTGERPYESISGKLWEWSLQSAGKIRQVSVLEQSIWCDKVLKKQDWQTVAHKYHLAGRKGVENAMNEMVKNFITNARTNNKKPPNFGQSYR